MPRPLKTQRRSGPGPHSAPPKQRRRKQALLDQPTPVSARSIAEAVIIKDEDLFFVTERDGCVPLGGRHGFGLYYHDCRYLNGYEMSVAGAQPDPLVASGARGYAAVLELTNADMLLGSGAVLPAQSLGVKWERVIVARKLALEERFTFTNFSLQPIEVPVRFTFECGFEDVFTVRGLANAPRGKLRRPRWDAGTLSFLYAGRDRICRSLAIHFSRPPLRKLKNSAEFRLRLAPDQPVELMLSFVVSESSKLTEVRRRGHERSGVPEVGSQLRQRSDRWLQQHTAVRTSSSVLDHAIDRSLRDLRVLRSQLDRYHYFAAGTPWYATLFGRDSIITALETLAYDPSIAAQTLRLLAKFQGTRNDEWRDEQPGKILHELRVGELAHLEEIPHTPYYGTVDATPLFLILLAEYVRWTGDLRLFRHLRPNVSAALDWIDRYGDLLGDGYLRYQSTSAKGLVNQGWKDSGDAIVNADGSLAEPPIALVEVQGYVYAARLGIAELLERSGEDAAAARLRRQAAQLRRRFNRDFWMAKYGIYALALEAGGRQARVVSSNPGHALWCGIADPDKGRRTADRLTRDDMFSGWGIRTLSTRARRYNPIGYHLGTVWPHDNALIAAGFRRYGCDDHLRTLFTSMVQAAERFTAFRLPEVFSGLSRAEYGVPVSYPVACHPQAWAAGAVPFMLQSALGLQPNALEGRLTIVRPVLPDPVSWVEVRRLRVGGDRVDLRFQRERSGDITVDVLNRPRRVEVVVERRPAPGDRESRGESRDSSGGAPARRHEGEKRIA